MAKRQKIRLGIVFFSFLIFPITINYHSPVLIVVGAVEGLVVASALLFALQFVSALVVGRGFCGWVCPGAGLQDACSHVRGRRIKGGNWFKWLLWVPWLAAILYLFVRAGGILGFDLLYQIEYGISVTGLKGLIIYFFFVMLIFAMAMIAGKRSFCHTVCWMAPFMIAGRKLRNLFGWPSLQLEAEPAKCVDCGKCDKACPMSLDVSKMVLEGRMENAECILCASCADACKTNAVSLTFGSR